MSRIEISYFLKHFYIHFCAKNLENRKFSDSDTIIPLLLNASDFSENTVKVAVLTPNSKQDKSNQSNFVNKTNRNIRAALAQLSENHARSPKDREFVALR